MAAMTSGNRIAQLSWSVLALVEAKYCAKAAMVPFTCRTEHALSILASHYHSVVDCLAFKASSQICVGAKHTARLQCYCKALLQVGIALVHLYSLLREQAKHQASHLQRCVDSARSYCNGKDSHISSCADLECHSSAGAVVLEHTV